MKRQRGGGGGRGRGKGRSSSAKPVDDGVTSSYGHHKGDTSNGENIAETSSSITSNIRRYST